MLKIAKVLKCESKDFLSQLRFMILFIAKGYDKMSQLGGIQHILCLRVPFNINECSITWRLLMETFHCRRFDEWVKIEKICGFLKVFYEVTCAFFGSKYPTSNLYFPNVLRVRLVLKDE